MRWKVEIRYREGIPDAVGRGVVGDVQDLGIAGVSDIRTAQLYWITGEVDASTVEKLCAELLTDAVTQTYDYALDETAGETRQKRQDAVGWVVEVSYKPGVTDTVGDSVMKGIRDMGTEGIEEVHTGHQYVLQADEVTRAEVESISKRLLANELIQTIELFSPLSDYRG